MKMSYQYSLSQAEQAGLDITTIMSIYQTLQRANMPIFGCGFDTNQFIIVIGRNLPQAVVYINETLTLAKIYPSKISKDITLEKLIHNLEYGSVK